MKNNLFREKTIEKISSPEELGDYIKTSTPSVMIMFSAVIILLFGALSWAVFGKIDITVSSVTVCEEGMAFCYISENDIGKINADAYARIEDSEHSIEAVSELPVPATDRISPYGLHIGNLENDEWVYIAEIKSLTKDGIYKTEIIIDSVSPISLLTN